MFAVSVAGDADSEGRRGHDAGSRLHPTGAERGAPRPAAPPARQLLQPHQEEARQQQSVREEQLPGPGRAQSSQPAALVRPALPLQQGHRRVSDTLV